MCKAKLLTSFEDLLVPNRPGDADIDFDGLAKEAWRHMGNPLEPVIVKSLNPWYKRTTRLPILGVFSEFGTCKFPVGRHIPLSH